MIGNFHPNNADERASPPCRGPARAACQIRSRCSRCSGPSQVTEMWACYSRSLTAGSASTSSQLPSTLSSTFLMAFLLLLGCYLLSLYRVASLSYLQRSRFFVGLLASVGYQWRSLDPAFAK